MTRPAVAMCMPTRPDAAAPYNRAHEQANPADAAPGAVIMDITRDLFPTDGRSPYLTLALASRDIESHNLLTRLSSAERERIGEALNAAAAVILDVLRGAGTDLPASEGHGTFGCGT